MISLVANVEVPDVEAGIEFHRQALGLRFGRRLFEGTVAEILGGSSPTIFWQKRRPYAAIASVYRLIQR